MAVHHVRWHMDGRRFDHFTRLLSSGTSRRTIIKGLLGFGGSAVLGSTIPRSGDARTIRSRPTVPPPSGPDCLLPMQMCGGECCPEGHCKEGVCCPNAGDVLCGGACCDTGLCTSNGTCCAAGSQVCGSKCCAASASCAINGNTDYCCDPSVEYPCGFDCCSQPGQCCDRECCASGMVCLNRIFAWLPEEYCCPIELTCDGQCCEGTCYTPLGSGATGFDRSCCPSTANLCGGEGPFSGVALCCSGDAFDCCHHGDGSPICLTPEQCCTDGECAHLTDPTVCLEGACLDFTCSAVDVCGAEAHCCPGFDNVCCPNGDDCCEREVNGTRTVLCIGPDQCCSDDDCTVFPGSFCDLSTNRCDCLDQTCETFAQQGICGDGLDNHCGALIDCGCGAGRQCCQDERGEPGACRPDPGCCTVDDCGPAGDACTTVSCLPDGTCSPTSCGSGLTCCTETLTCIDPETQCCDFNDCDALGFDFDCIFDCIDHTCVPSGDGESCENTCLVCSEGHCVPDETVDPCGSDDGVCCNGECCEGLCCDYDDGYFECVEGECCYDSDCEASNCEFCNNGTCTPRCGFSNATCCPVSGGRFDCLFEDVCPSTCTSNDDCSGQVCCDGVCCSSADCCERSSGARQCIFDDVNNSCCDDDECSQYNNPQACFVGVCVEDDDGGAHCQGRLNCNSSTEQCCNGQCVSNEDCCRDEPCPPDQCCFRIICVNTCSSALGLTCCPEDNTCRSSCAA